MPSEQDIQSILENLADDVRQIKDDLDDIKNSIEELEDREFDREHGLDRASPTYWVDRVAIHAKRERDCADRLAVLQQARLAQDGAAD